MAHLVRHFSKYSDNSIFVSYFIEKRENYVKLYFFSNTNVKQCENIITKASEEAEITW